MQFLQCQLLLMVPLRKNAFDLSKVRPATKLSTLEINSVLPVILKPFRAKVGNTAFSQKLKYGNTQRMITNSG